MLKTRVTEILGIEHPILQGGMAWAASAELAAAVSNAGGLGIVGAGDSPTDVVRRELKRVRSLTSRPFGANVPLFMPGVEKVLQVFIDEGVSVVTVGGGNAGPYLSPLQQAGIRTVADPRAGAERYVALRSEWDPLARQLAPLMAYGMEEVDPAGEVGARQGVEGGDPDHPEEGG